MEVRQVYIEELNLFINDAKRRYNDILNALSWTEEGIALSHQKVKESDSKEANESSVLEAKDKAGPVDFSSKLQDSKTSEELYNEFLASLPSSVTTKDAEDNKKTLAELLAAERDAKRRRASYKNKVHTKNKSYTEVMKEVIHQQMELLKGCPDSEDGSKEHMVNTEVDRKKPVFELDPVETAGNPYTIWKNIERIVERKERIKEVDVDGTRLREKGRDRSKRESWRCRSSERNSSHDNRKHHQDYNRRVRDKYKDCKRSYSRDEGSDKNERFSKENGDKRSYVFEDSPSSHRRSGDIKRRPRSKSTSKHKAKRRRSPSFEERKKKHKKHKSRTKSPS